MHDPQLDAYLEMIGSRLRSIPRKRREEELMEIRGHLDALIALQLERGVPPDDAIRAALEQFGTPTEIGDALEEVWNTHRARYWPPNRIAFMSTAIAILGAVATFATLLDGRGNPRLLMVRGEEIGTQLVYIALFFTAVAAAYIARSWKAAAAIPLFMLLTWVAFDRLITPDLINGWGRSYLGRVSPLHDALVHHIIRGLQLVPAVAGALIGTAIGILRWGAGSNRDTAGDATPAIRL